jgi:hypothetical protein
MTNNADLVAEFLARGGKVQKVETGARAIADSRMIWNAAKEGVKVAGDAVREARESEYAYHAERDAFQAAKYSGMNTGDAYAYAQETRFRETGR